MTYDIKVNSKDLNELNRNLINAARVSKSDTLQDVSNGVTAVAATLGANHAIASMTRADQLVAETAKWSATNGAAAVATGSFTSAGLTKASLCGVAIGGALGALKYSLSDDKNKSLGSDVVNGMTIGGFVGGLGYMLLN